VGRESGGIIEKGREGGSGWEREVGRESGCEEREKRCKEEGEGEGGRDKWGEIGGERKRGGGWGREGIWEYF
jgi:hypothetical protein